MEQEIAERVVLTFCVYVGMASIMGAFLIGSIYGTVKLIVVLVEKIKINKPTTKKQEEVQFIFLDEYDLEIGELIFKFEEWHKMPAYKSRHNNLLYYLNQYDYNKSYTEFDYLWNAFLNEYDDRELELNKTYLEAKRGKK
ncbi:MAG: hypothetical protein GY679_01905 [Mycoplasma sp.]|nr:hypothetical protein [Mycoplasma sp.]